LLLPTNHLVKRTVEDECERQEKQHLCARCIRGDAGGLWCVRARPSAEDLCASFAISQLQ
jgi:hypothetical protein